MNTSTIEKTITSSQITDIDELQEKLEIEGWKNYYEVDKSYWYDSFDQGMGYIAIMKAICPQNLVWNILFDASTDDIEIKCHLDVELTTKLKNNN